MESEHTRNPYESPHSDVTQSREGTEERVRVFALRGRLGRVRYMAYVIGLFVATWLLNSVVIGVTFIALGGVGLDLTALALPLVVLFYYVPLVFGLFALTVRRLNDCNWSGWWSLLLLLPLVNVLFSIALWMVPGTDGANQYGARTPPNGMAVSFAATLAPLSLIAYIGVITAIAIPAYKDYMAHGKETVQNR